MKFIYKICVFSTDFNYFIIFYSVQNILDAWIICYDLCIFKAISKSSLNLPSKINVKQIFIISYILFVEHPELVEHYLVHVRHDWFSKLTCFTTRQKVSKNWPNFMFLQFLTLSITHDRAHGLSFWTSLS